jgi:hypothetical protein
MKKKPVETVACEFKHRKFDVTFTPVGTVKAAKKIEVPPIFKIGQTFMHKGEVFTIYETDGFNAKAVRFET